MEDHSSAVARLLVQLLSTSTPNPELGARLKQRLKAALIANGIPPINEAALGFRKFSDYLLRTFGDLILIQTREEGDIFVSLRNSAVGKALPAPPPLPTSRTSDSLVIRSAVWQAFANPDTQRKRYFNRRTGQVVHYLDGLDSPSKIRIKSNPSEFVEIIPIPKDVQVSWMRDFLDSITLPPEEKSAFDDLLAKSYSSTVNAMFTRLLGINGDAWRKFRTARITQKITDWLQREGVHESLLHPSISDETVQVVGTSEMVGAAPATREVESASGGKAREKAIKLLDLLSDEDIAHLVIPVLATTITIKSRL